MADCNELITGGIEKDCATINAAIGVDKDLILVNYEDFDKAKTLLAAIPVTHPRKRIRKKPARVNEHVA